LRDSAVWGAALLFLMTAFFTVGVRREVYAIGRAIGDLERRVQDARRRGDNLELLRERLASPARLTLAAEAEEAR
jgi:hypothetical protein